MVLIHRKRETGNVGVGADIHERRARKRTGWKAHIESKTQGADLPSIQCGPSSQFVFELVSRDCQPPLPLFLSLSFNLTLHHSFTLSYSGIFAKSAIFQVSPRDG